MGARRFVADPHDVVPQVDERPSERDHREHVADSPRRTEQDPHRRDHAPPAPLLPDGASSRGRSPGPRLKRSSRWPRAHGGRDEARELLVACWSTAHDLGAHDLERRAVNLATRTRVPLPDSATRKGPLSRLTPREREVLDLLVTGATNKTIAITLFITEKTASVHVSNLLAKLGVTNRGEAAALARHLLG
jgi:DNA-binding CsgD family transcriptional regulator